MSVSVEIQDLENIQYSEYYLTGFYILKKKGLIDKLKINYSPIAHRDRFRRLLDYALQKGGIRAVHRTDGWQQFKGAVHFEGKTKTFAVNMQDTPWDFGNKSLLEQTDVFFKVQYPTNFNEGYMQLSSKVKINLPECAIQNAYKIHPLMLGRPLSRTLNFEKNLAILKHYDEKRRNEKRRYSMLVYLGMADDSYDIPNTHHPHLKRAMLAAWCNDNLVDAKIVFKKSKQEKFLKELPEAANKISSHQRITDKKYTTLIQNSFSTLNITGLRGSVPFRIIDSMLSGMVTITDSMHIKWYEPLIPNIDFLEIGEMGYELIEEIDFNRCCLNIKKYEENIKEIFRDTQQIREERYKTYYAPEIVAKHILQEIQSA